jgi:hypothetical protein
MGALHALTTQNGGIRIAIHITTPAGTNAAGVTWVLAYLRSHGTLTTVLVDGDGTGGTIAAAEKTSVTGGAVIELVDSFPLPSNWAALSAAQRNTAIDAWAAANQNELLLRLQDQLRYFGIVR